MGKQESAWHGFAWILGAISIPILVMAGTAACMLIPPDTRGIDLVAGAESFTVHCASCHFTKVGHPAHLGPNLHEIGRTAATRKPNQSAAQYILESILDPPAFVAPSGRPGMPPDIASRIDPEAIRNIVGFLASRGASPDYGEITGLEIPDRRREETGQRVITLSDMQLAESVLREKGACLGCHTVDSRPEGRTIAPGLFCVGLNDPKSLYESITRPEQQVHPAYQVVNVLLKHGEIVTGRLMSQSDDVIVLCCTDNKNQCYLRDVPVSDVDDADGTLQVHASPSSLMPTGFDKLLSPEEIDALVKLILQLN